MYENKQMRALSRSNCRFLSLWSESRDMGETTIYLEERDEYVSGKGTAWGC